MAPLRRVFGRHSTKISAPMFHPFKAPQRRGDRVAEHRISARDSMRHPFGNAAMAAILMLSAAMSALAQSAAAGQSSVAPDPAPTLVAMDAAIRAGTFSQITSVIVAQRGQIIHEQYFDTGGSDALRNTRSATKTVTAMLVGA